MVYIDIDMPKHCGECPLLMDWCPLYGGIPAHQINLEHRPDWCPLKDNNEETMRRKQ